MSKAIRERAEALKERIRYMSKKDAVKEVKKEVSILKKRYKLATVRTYLTVYRSCFSSRRSHIIKALSITDREQYQLTQKAKIKRSENMRNQVCIRDIEAMIERAKELVSSSSYNDILAGLCLLTGRRRSELMKSAKFTRVTGSKNKLYFKGQLKTKDNKDRYIIYALGDSADLCKSGLKRLRALKDCSKMSTKEIDRRFQKSTNTAINRHFFDFVGGDKDMVTSHRLRAVYSIYCFEYHRPKGISANLFLSELLGHKEGDFDTLNNYQRYYIE